MKRTPMTARGAEILRAELKRLKSDARPRVIQAIAEARAHGDLSENAEYHAAREQQGFIEGRIKELEAKFSERRDHRSEVPAGGPAGGIRRHRGAGGSGRCEPRRLPDRRRG